MRSEAKGGGSIPREGVVQSSVARGEGNLKRALWKSRGKRKRAKGGRGRAGGAKRDPSVGQSRATKGELTNNNKAGETRRIDRADSRAAMPLNVAALISIILQDESSSEYL